MTKALAKNRERIIDERTVGKGSTSTLPSEFGPTIAGFSGARKSPQAFAEFVKNSRYVDLMLSLRNAAIRAKANPDDVTANAILNEAAKALELPRSNLTMLTDVAADLVANGKWRPRAVNLDFCNIDSASAIEATGYRKMVDDLSRKMLPKSPAVRVPGMHTAYRIAEKALPPIDAAGRVVSRPILAAASVLRGFSEGQATDFQQMMWHMRRTLRSAHMRNGQFRALPPEQQRMVAKAARVLSGTTIDVERLLAWARSANSEKMPEKILARFRRWGTEALHTLAGTLSAIGNGVRAWTNADDWACFSVHLMPMGTLNRDLLPDVRIGKNLEVFGPFGFGADATFMFPPLCQVARDGKAEVRVIPKVVLYESPFGGATATSRGGEIRNRLVNVSAQVAAYEHHATIGVPGKFGVDLGDDYAYGPLVALTLLPRVHKIGSLTLPENPVLYPRVGGEVVFFHPALGMFRTPTRKAAEFLTVSWDACQNGLVNAYEAVTRRPKRKMKMREGWPVRQSWVFTRERVERGESAARIASERLVALRAIEPTKLLEQIAPEAKRMLAGNPGSPAELHATIVRHLESAIAGLEEDTKAVRALAAKVGANESIDKKMLRKREKAIERQAVAFEFVDVLVSSMLAKPNATPTNQPSR